MADALETSGVEGGTDELDVSVGAGVLVVESGEEPVLDEEGAAGAADDDEVSVGLEDGDVPEVPDGVVPAWSCVDAVDAGAEDVAIDEPDVSVELEEDAVESVEVETVEVEVVPEPPPPPPPDVPEPEIVGADVDEEDVVVPS